MELSLLSQILPERVLFNPQNRPFLGHFWATFGRVLDQYLINYIARTTYLSKHVIKTGICPEVAKYRKNDDFLEVPKNLRIYVNDDNYYMFT